MRPAASSENARATMRANRSTSALEVRFRKELFSRGIRGYRITLRLPGRPDIVYPGARLAVFVHGCFWHGCPICRLPEPKANGEFWQHKRAENAARDERVVEALRDAGWRTEVVWEHEIRASLDDPVRRIQALVDEGRSVQAKGEPGVK